jgi:CRISPR-associated endonuclease/helicase Cas3
VGVGAVEDARFGGIDLLPYGRFNERTGTPYSLVFAMLDHAAMAMALWDRLLAPNQRQVLADGTGLEAGRARAVVGLLAGLQQIGMLVPEYQRRRPRVWTRLSPDLVSCPVGAPVLVERMSMHLSVGLLAGMGFGAGGNACPAVRAAQVVGSGAGVFLQVDVAGAASPGRVGAVAGTRAWQDLQRRYARVVQHLVGAGQAPVRFTAPAAVLAAGLVQVAARAAARQEWWTDEADMPAFGCGEHYARAVERCAEYLAGRGWDRVDLDEIAFGQAHPHAGPPSVLQRSLLESLPGLADVHGAGIVVVRDATGTGKSIVGLEAARVFNQAVGSRGVAWLMPTALTADAGWELLDAYVRAHEPDEPVPVALAHSHTALNAAYTDRTPAGRTGGPQPEVGQRTARPPATTGDCCAPARPSALASPDAARDDEGGDGGGDLQGDVTAAGVFSGSGQTTLLAQFCAATIDQALMAVLPVDSSAVRMLGLSGKTVVVDEAHAPQPFSRAQLLRLLAWLGALGTPVVVLSATLPARDVDRMVDAYRHGHRTAGASAAVDGRTAAPPSVARQGADRAAGGGGALGYPGWLFADTRGGVHLMDPGAARAHAAALARRVSVSVHPVLHRRLGEDASREIAAGERLDVVTGLLRDVTGLGGCAVVSCATVTDAQDTYRHLRASRPDTGDQVVLLHARLPGHLRAARTAYLRTALGRDRRPHRLVAVTTSVLDTGIDIDCDLMISDLASLALLLQRLGRLGRFELSFTGAAVPVRRPAWWNDGHIPAFHVLNPVGDSGATAVPAAWRTLEPAVLLQATAALLNARGSGRTLHLPGDVQDLVEAVHGEHAPFTRDGSPLAPRAAALHHKEISQTHLSALHMVPPPGRVSSLADLHRQQLSAAQAATRLGALPQRLLPCYLREDGRAALDRAGVHVLPSSGPLRTADVRHVLAHTVPVPPAWVAARTHRHHPPQAWTQHRLLGDLVLLPAPAGDLGHVEYFGRYGLRMDDDLGLVTTRTTDTTPAASPHA